MWKIFEILFWAAILYFWIGKDLINYMIVTHRRRKERMRCTAQINNGKNPLDIFRECLDIGVFRFGDVVDTFPHSKRPNPASLGKIARELDIDFDDKRERQAITSLNMDATAILFRAAETGYDLIAGYLMEDWDGYLFEKMCSFRAAGFTNAETLEAFLRGLATDSELTNGDIVAAAIKLPVPNQEIADALAEWEIDLDDLDLQMYDASVKLKDRIQILQLLLDKKPEETTENAGITAGLI